MSLSLLDYMSEVGLDKWFAILRATSAPLTRRNVRTALRFFATHMPKLPPSMAASFLDAMDLGKRVEEISLAPGERLLAFRGSSESQYKLFFTRRGASPVNTGINYAGRRAVHFVVRIATPALESYSIAANDSWTAAAPGQRLTFDPRSNRSAVMSAGGNVQIIVPESYTGLLLERDG
jgi:hypothetical protein